LSPWRSSFEEGAQAELLLGAVEQLLVAFSALAQFGSDRVALLVFGDEVGRLGVADPGDLGDQVADAPSVGRETELHLGADLVALGHRDLAHVVAEAAELRALPVVPGARGAHPGAEPVMDFGVGPMADDDLAAEPHAGVDEPRLAVAVRRLVEVHEIHVDRAPRQLGVELGVEMSERLLQRVEAADPHLRRREGVHPQDQARAIGIGIGFEAQLENLVGRGQQRLEHGLERQLFRFGERAGDLLGVGGDLLERSRPVEVLRPADEPDFRIGEEDHVHLSRLGVGVQTCYNSRIAAASGRRPAG